jgi:very-short-patch-repair endonuclease/predicted transcriptional regulator of viral defense system
MGGNPVVGRETGPCVPSFGHPLVEAELVELGLRQHAVFDLDQLKGAGLSDSAVRKRVARSRLHRIYTRVYALVPLELLTRDGRFMAAVLACGAGSALSHRSGGILHDLAGSSRTRIDVTIPRRSGRAHRGIHIHRSTALTDADITPVNSIPCTTVARTLFDLADVLQRRPLERAFDQAEAMGAFNLLAIEDQIERNPTRPAAAKVRALLDEHYVGSSVTDSEFEEVLFPLLRAAGLPLPRTRYYAMLEDGEPAIRRDFAWPDQCLNAETDGKKFHRTAQAFETDRYNDQRMLAGGWRVIRITWKQLEREPQRVVALIARLLAA